MDGEELGGTFVISVDELGLSGLWSTIKDLVESRMPLQGLTLPNKVGKLVAVPRLPLTFVLSTDKRLLRLKQYSHSPVTWFRNPHTHLVLVSTADVHEYKSTTRAQLKRLTADIEKDWGGSAVGSEWLILYVRPFELEPSDKGAKKVFEKLCDDFGSKRRERVVRLDVPLRAFDGPAATAAGSRAGTRVTTAGAYAPIGTQPGSPSGFAAAAAQGAVWGFGAVGLDELAAGLRDSIRSAFEARQAAYDAEIRRLLNERREPKWSFTTLYLVKDSFALMLEGAGLWEDAFQEYVELEAVYLDCLEAAAAAAAAAAATPSEAAAAAIKEAADFGLTGNDTEDVASLLSSSWRNMRRLVLWKKCVQEFHFRQYLFAAQARVLLRLNRPVDVAERGLVFIQNFLSILAAREAAGQVKPWFKECWAFSACMSLITVITAFTAQSHTLSPDWEVTDLLGSSGSSSGSSGPQGAAAQAAMRQLMAAAAADKAAAAGGDAKAGSAKGKGTESERLAHARSITVTGTPQHPIVVSPRGNALSPGSSSSSSSSVPVLTASEWELVYVKDSGGIAAAAAGDSDDEEDVPPLDMAVLCGQAITPGNAGLLLAGEQRRELMDKLYNCLLGHLYHLARGELLRLGAALRLTEAAAAAGGASILQLGKAAFAPSPAAAAAGQVVSHKDHGSGKARSSTAAVGAADRQQKSAAAGADLLAAAAATGNLSPRMVAQLQELLLTPLCGYSQMINKYADGCSDGLAYEVHTPKLGLDADPLAAALSRRDSQSTASGFANSLITTALHTTGSNSSSAAATGQHSPTAAAAERLRRGNSSGSSTPKSQQQHTVGQHSRLSRATAEEDNAAATAAAGGGGGSSRVDALKHADSGTNLATVSINATGDASSSTASDNPQSSAAVDHEDAENAQEKATGIPCLTANAGSLSGAAGSGLRDMTDLPRVATHTRSVSALPASVSGSNSSSNKPSAIAAANGNMASLLISPRRLEALADSAPLVPSGTAASQRAAAAAAGGSLSLVHPGAAATAAAAVPGWVGEWRLQLALRSAAAFQELLLALSRRAGRCYAKSGRVRSSALIYADVAVMALQRGQVEQAARLLDRMQRIFTSEGWQLLLGALLPKLLAVQRLAAQPLLPFTAVAVLALPPAAAAASDRQAAYEELLSAVGAPYVMDQLTGMNGLGSQLGFRLDQKAANGQQQQQLVQLATHDAIQLRPAAGTYSHFFGNEAPENTSTDHMQRQQQQQQLMVPVLSPPAQPLASTAGSSRQAAAAANGGAALVAVGDSFSLTVDVVSRLPGPVLLRHLVLSLVQLHKSSWLSSVGGNSIFASAADMSIAGGSTAAAGGGGLNLLAMDQGIGRGKGDGWGFSRASTLGLGGLHVPGSNDSPRSAVQRWQEGEELVSNKLRAAYTPGAAADTAGAAGAAAGSSGGYRCQLLSDGYVLLVPGINRLVFTISPVREGLYCLKQLRALLGSCGELLIGLPPPGALSLLAAAAAGSSKDQQQQQQQSGDDSSGNQSCTAEVVPYTSFGSTGNAPEAVQIGGVTAAGAVVSEVVVARVLGPAPRLKLSPVLPEGCLPVSCTAWLGVLLSPLHDVTLWQPRVYILPNKLVTLAATTGPGVLAGSNFNFGLGGISGSTDSVTEQQQQQQRSLNALPSFAAGVGSGQQQAAHWVFGVPLQQTATAAATASSSVSAAAAVAGEGRWVCVRRGGCVDLGDFCGADGSLSSPLLLWMQVQVGHPQTLPATVRVTKPTVTAAAVPSLTRTSTAAITATATPDGVRLSAAWDKQHQQSLLQQQPSTPLSLPAAAAAAVQCIPECSLLLPSRPSDTAAEVSLQVEYSAGVWRSHASTLLLPLQQPAAVTAAAMQLPNGCIALNITVAPDADLSTSLLLMEVGLRPQYGLILSRRSSSGSMMSHQGGLSNLASGFSDVLPMRLFPGASAGLCFVLSRDQGDKLAGSFEDDGSSLLMISYVLEHTSTEQQVTDAATGLALPPPPSTVSSGQSPSAVGTAPRSSSGSDEDASADGGRVIPSSPAVAAADAAAAGRVMTMRLPFWLEIPSDTPSTAVASLRATLLGPFQGRVGQPLMLTWQIARTGHDEDHHDGTAGFDGVTDTSFPGFSHVSLSESLGEAVGSVSGRVSVEHDGPSSRSGDYDEVLCYEITPGVTKPQGGSSQGDLLRASYQSPRHGGSVAHGFAAGLTRAQTSSLNPNEGIVWWEGSNPSGSVRLGRAAGSLATVEVVLVPIVAGRQLAPQLVMRSLPVGGIQPLDVAGGSVGGHEEGFIYIQP